MPTSRLSMKAAPPSALLRAPDEETRERQYTEFVADLKLVAKKLD